MTLAIVCAGFGANTGAAEASPLPAWAPIASTGPTVLPPVQNATQDLVVTAEGGTFTMTFNGQTTSALAFNASEKEVETALNGLSSIGGVGGSVRVKGGPGGPSGNNSPYVVVFEGSFSGINEPTITANSGGLTGSSKTVSVASVIGGGPGTSILDIFIQNIGGAASAGEITLTGTLPPGVLLNGPATQLGSGWSCTNSGDAKSFTCTNSSLAIKSGIAAVTPFHPLIAEPGASGTGVVHIAVSGGGAGSPGTFEMPLTVSPSPAGPGFQSFTGGAYDEEGKKDTRAGGHPFSATSGVMANTVRTPQGRIVPANEFRNIKVSLPPGFFGNPTATPPCPASTPEPPVSSGGGIYTECPLNTIVGVAQPVNQLGQFFIFSEEPVVNVEAPIGYPAEFRFNFGGEPIHVIGSLRSDSDYGVDVESPNTPQIIPVYGAFFVFWGTPASHVHDVNRCTSNKLCGPSTAPEVAFLTNPTNCAEEAAVSPFARLTTDTWGHSDVFEHEDIVLPPVTGCENLHFESQFGFQPSEAARSDSPGGFSTEIKVPVEGLTDPTKRITPELKKVVATLPLGVSVNPSAAGGLGACSEAQIGFEGANLAMPNPTHFNKNQNQCPDSSKIGTVELTTSLLSETLHGALYLAAQGEGNPFGSLFAVYLVIEDFRNGVFIKLPGELEADKTTGQLTATFDDLPQLPFTVAKLSIKGGSRSPLALPRTCGSYGTRAVMTPWSAPESGPPFENTDSFTVSNGPGGSPCAHTLPERPFNPVLNAGTASTTAGAFTPFSLRLVRNDGEQELDSIETVAPPGFVGVLTGIPFCSEAAIKAAQESTGKAEQQAPSCPAASELGSLTAGVGVGSTPFYAQGKAYLAGAYDGAPLSIVFVTPAVAGPFDLGDVVVRAGIYVDKETARITVKTGQLPQILDGVPLQIRSIEATIDRPDFGLNPTSCEKFQVSTVVHGTNGAVATPSRPFQVGGCANLSFKPRFSVSTTSKTSRTNGASLSVKLQYPQGSGQANIAKVKVDLPKQLPSRLTTLQKACTETVFDANPANCPAESIVGSAKAITPVLPVPLVGPAYFVSHGGAKFPELILVLQGYGITIDLRGETFINSAGITSSTFNTVPDVPVGSFELNLPQGPYSALAANGNLCTSKLTMPTSFTAQNGMVIQRSTPVTVTGCAKARALTRAQKLKQALKACHKDKLKAKRKACEAVARKKYGPQSKGKTSKRRK